MVGIKDTRKQLKGTLRYLFLKWMLDYDIAHYPDIRIDVPDYTVIPAFAIAPMKQYGRGRQSNYAVSMSRQVARQQRYIGLSVSKMYSYDGYMCLKYDTKRKEITMYQGFADNLPDELKPIGRIMYAELRNIVDSYLPYANVKEVKGACDERYHIQ